MASDMRVLAVIPARGGSKQVPRKNLREVAGRPLIAWTITCAMAARHHFCRIIVSTDDNEIAAVSRKWGAEVPFLRPPNLAADDTPTLPVLQHAVSAIEAEMTGCLDWIMLLQPTSPLRSVSDIEAVMRLAQMGESDSVISVVRLRAHHPRLAKRIESGYLRPYAEGPLEGGRRQDCEPAAFLNNGAIYLTRRDVLMKEGKILGARARPYEMPEERSLDVDSEFDLAVVSAALGARLGS